jgi:aconitate hydratase
LRLLEMMPRDLVAVGIISSNRNFEGRLNPSVRGTFLASPPLVVAYTIAGSILTDLSHDKLGDDPDGRPVFLADIWPADAEIRDCLDGALTHDLFRAAYDRFFEPGAKWSEIAGGTEPVFAWDPASMYLRRPPFLDERIDATAPIRAARLLLLLGDDLTTDHISPGGAIPATAEAGVYLIANGVPQPKFGTYIGRRANHEVMVRGTFANIRLRNELVPGREGGLTRHQPSGEIMSVFAAAERYRAEGRAAIVVAGRNYGCGSSRDWAAKGTALLGIRAVIAESFERIHRSNLVGMGVLPLQFPPGMTRRTLALAGDETFDIEDVGAALVPGGRVPVRVLRASGAAETLALLSRVDTRREAEWLRHGGILPYVLEELGAG